MNADAMLMSASDEPKFDGQTTINIKEMPEIEAYNINKYQNN